jgi:hypothetical protein
VPNYFANLRVLISRIKVLDRDIKRNSKFVYQNCVPLSDFGINRNYIRRTQNLVVLKGCLLIRACDFDH